ncbi:MAG TPA: hypothetical protein VGO93_30815, partial [Candidatus Xenobia bacterium]
MKATATLSSRDFADIRRKMILDHCKWDPQVGDVSTLADFALVMQADAWSELARLAEQLTAELLTVETQLLAYPTLWPRLGLPAPLARALRRNRPTPAAARVMRFDFHPTWTGWQISEVNSDVPGGYTEGAAFTQLMAAALPGTRPAGNPLQAVTEALGEGTIGLLSAAGYMEDHQVIATLAGALRQSGRQVVLANPAQVEWRHGRASVNGNPVDAIVRFFQAEWLPTVRGPWERFLTGGLT